MKRLIFFIGVYDTLDLFTFELKREFENLGYETMVFDVRDMAQGLKRLAEFALKPVKAVITFNNLGFNMELKAGKNIWDQLGIPCINILMDHPFCYKNALDQAPQNAVVLCTDRNHMRYLQRFYPKIQTVGFLPHAGKEISGAKRPISERGTDVLYAGNLSKTFAANIMPDLSKYTDFDAKSICEQAYQELIRHPFKTTEQALEEALNAAGLRLSEEELKDMIAELHFVDLYAVSYMTWFKDGTHDRVFNGMLQGAVAVTDSSGYMKEEFGGYKEPKGREEELLFFELEELDKLPVQIQELLSDPKRAQQIANRGYQKAKQFHTWRARAIELEQDLLMQI